MSMTDPIADMLTRIRNAQHAQKKQVSIPYSKTKAAIAAVLEQEGYIDGSEKSGEGAQAVLEVRLRYYEGKPVINELRRFSRPGLRAYRGKDDLPKVMGGLGVAIVSTSQGIMTDRAARKAGHGGEVICFVS